MFQIAKWTLRQRKWYIFWWCIGIGLMVFITLIFYPTIRSQSDQLNKSFSQIPQTAKQLFTDTNDIFSPIGYLSSQLYYLMLPMLIGILGINLGVSLVGKEERSSTIEMLLARPVSRGKLLFGKALAGLTVIAFVVVVVGLLASGLCKAVGLGVAAPTVFMATIAVGLLALSFSAIAFMFTALGRFGRSASIGISALIALGGYIVVSLSPSVHWLNWPSKGLPFNYYRANELLTGYYNWANISYFVGVITASLLIAWLIFRRRDLESE